MKLAMVNLKLVTREQSMNFVARYAPDAVPTWSLPIIFGVDVNCVFALKPHAFDLE